MFEAIGFFNEFNRAKAFLLKEARALGFYLTSQFDDWMLRRRAFMHTINHPAIYVVHELGRIALLREGFTELRDDAMLTDPLSSRRCPVHPLIATRLEIEESPMFAFKQRILTLAEFIPAAYQLLREIPREVIRETISVAWILTALERAGI